MRLSVGEAIQKIDNFVRGWAQQNRVEVVSTDAQYRAWLEAQYSTLKQLCQLLPFTAVIGDDRPSPVGIDPNANLAPNVNRDFFIDKNANLSGLKPAGQASVSAGIDIGTVLLAGVAAGLGYWWATRK